MKKVTILVVAMLALSASLAMAASGVNLYLNDCGQGTTQTNSVTNTCLTNSGTAFAAIGSIIIPTVTKNNFVGEISIVDVQTNAVGQIEDWWRADACRNTSFTLSTDAGITSSCSATLWDAATPAGNNVQAVYGAPGSPANRMRYALGAVLLPTDVYNLTGDGVTEETVFKFTVLKSRSVGAGACAGCASGACMVLNEVQLQGQSDTGDADYVHITTAITNNFISYNAAAGIPTCPSSVPVRNRTWGSVKALYR